MSDLAPFLPAWACPPGATITALMNVRKVSFEQFSSAIGLTAEDTMRLLHGEQRITAALGVGQWAAEFAVYQQRRLIRRRGGVAARAQRHQQHRQRHARRFGS